MCQLHSYFIAQAVDEINIVNRSLHQSNGSLNQHFHKLLTRSLCVCRILDADEVQLH